MSLFDVLREECIEVNSSISSGEEVLKAIARLAKRCDVLENVEEDFLYKQLQERESLGSTGFGDGIAIPHCRLDNISEFVVGIITVPSGIDFGAIDGKKSTLFIFIIAPEEERNRHIRLLASISRTLSQPGVTDELLQKSQPVDLRESFLRHVCDTSVVKRKNEERCSFQIAVQDQEKFDTILEILSSLSASMTVIEGNNAEQYLDALPLFSSFWNDKSKGFHRLITGLINKKLVNELMRNCELLVDEDAESNGFSVLIQDVLLSLGKLD